jgi:hypothetical protein
VLLGHQVHVATQAATKPSLAAEALRNDPSQIDSVHDHGRRRAMIGSNRVAIGQVI